MNREKIKELLHNADCIARVAEPNKAGCNAISRHIQQALEPKERKPVCKTCKGSGFDPDDKGGATESREPLSCPACKGTGVPINPSPNS